MNDTKIKKMVQLFYKNDTYFKNIMVHEKQKMVQFLGYLEKSGT